MATDRPAGWRLRVAPIDISEGPRRVRPAVEQYDSGDRPDDAVEVTATLRLAVDVDDNGSRRTEQRFGIALVMGGFKRGQETAIRVERVGR